VADGARIPRIYVVAGTNGAGKSSIVGAMFQREGVEYFNPDEATRLILSRNPNITQEEANSAAWKQGKRLLERAIEERLDFAFETTLGGNTITSLLEKALSAGIEVRIAYIGLNSPELHIERVRSLVARGGHDVPEARIRDRYHNSRINLVRLLPTLAELRVYDNSKEADPETGVAPEPLLIVHMVGGKIVGSCDLLQAPEWAKPILAAAVRRSSEQ
jgi:predicted ABC-type ATPase